MAFGTPYLIGSAGGTTTAAQVITSGTATTAGDTIIVDCGNSSAAGATITSVTDSKGNTYAAANSAVTAGEFGHIWISLNSTALAVSDTITINFSTTTGSKACMAIGVSGVATSAAVDQAPAGTHATSTAPSVTSGTLAQATEMAIGVINSQSTGGVPSGLGSFTSVGSFQSGSSPEVTVAYLATAATTAITFSGTIVSANWCAMLITLLPASGTKSADVTATETATVTATAARGTTAAATQTAAAAVTAAAGLAATAAASLAVSATITAGATTSSTKSADVSATETATVTAAANLAATAAASLAATATVTAGATVTSGTPPFPRTPIDLDIDLNLNTWTEISPYVMQRDQNTPLTISRGTPDENTQPAPSSATMQLNNRDNRFSSRNPAGPYFGVLGRNTPLRASVPATVNGLRMEDDAVSSASCPTAAALNLAGDLEARIDLNLSNWTATVLACKWSAAAGNFSWAWLLNADGTMTFQYTADGSTIRTAQSSQPLPWPGGRISLKVTYATASGAVAFYWATAIGGSYTQIGTTVTGTGTGALFAGTAALTAGYSAYFAGVPGYLDTTGGVSGNVWSPAAYGGITGLVHEFQLRNGIGGSLVADPIFRTQTPGAASFADAQANTWTMNGTATISGRQYRYHGEVAEWPPKQDTSGNDVWMPITASGVLRRLAAGNAPLDSAMTRAWQRKTGTYAPVAYWPGEDGNNATATTLGLAVASSSTPDRITSGLATGNAMTLTGKASTFASSSTFACSNALPVPGTGTWTGRVKGYTLPASPAVVHRFLLATPSTGDTDTAVLARVYSSGTCTRLDLQYGVANNGGLQLSGYDSTGTQLFSSGYVQFRVNNAPCMVEMALTVSGGTVTWHINTLTVGATLQSGLSNTFAGSIGVASVVVINPNGVQVSSAIGQMAVQNAYATMSSATSADSLIGPLNAWAQETAGQRVARLCGEQGFASRILGNPASSVVMGPQTPQTFITLLQECAQADHGMLFEPRTSLSVGYRCSMTLANQAAGISGALPVQLDYNAAQLGDGQLGIEPTDDDQLTRNDEIVTRGTSSVTGASYEVTMTQAQFAASNNLSISPPPVGVGLYQDSKTVNVLGDNQLGDQAGWLVHLGTVDELRYPVIPVSLARAAVAAISANLQALDLGDYVQIINPPPWLEPDAVKVIIWGAKEVVGGYKWEMQWQTQPESPWEVLTAGSGALSDNRADTDGSTLAAGYTSSATSLSVATAAGLPLWTTAAGDLPFDIIVAGERMTVTAISGTSSPQTFTVTRSVNAVVKAQASGAVVNIFAPVYLALT